MRKFLLFILVFSLLALLLSGCREQPAVPESTPAQTEAEASTREPASVPTESTIPAAVPEETTIPVTEPEETQTPLTEPEETQTPLTEPEETLAPDPTEASENELPYLLQIPRADQSIYHGPGYDYGYSCTVRKAGIYTIVEEAADYEGNLWGKLKSGIGWVDLTQIRSEARHSPLISANYADQDLRQSACHLYSSSEEYLTSVAFRAYCTLRDVTLFRYELSDSGYYPGEDFFTLAELTPDMPLVADLSFPGDMTTYGIRFVDAEGKSHVYSIYISGRNGALMLSEE